MLVLGPLSHLVAFDEVQVAHLLGLAGDTQDHRRPRSGDTLIEE